MAKTYFMVSLEIPAGMDSMDMQYHIFQLIGYSGGEYHPDDPRHHLKTESVEVSELDMPKLLAATQATEKHDKPELASPTQVRIRYKKKHRVLRVLEYEGDLEWINKTLADSGVQNVKHVQGNSIRSAVVGLPQQLAVLAEAVVSEESNADNPSDL
jgi:hypothetical protein